MAAESETVGKSILVTVGGRAAGVGTCRWVVYYGSGLRTVCECCTAENTQSDGKEVYKTELILPMEKPGAEER